MDLRLLRAQYLADAETRQGLSPKTIRTYHNHIGLFLAWFETTQDRAPLPAEYTLTTLQTYDTSRARRGVGQRCRAAQASALRSWARFMCDHGHITEVQLLPITSKFRVRITERPKRARVTDDQVSALFAACNQVSISRDHRAYRPSLCGAVLACMIYAALRRGEVLGLKLADLDLDAPAPTLRVLGKGNKWRTVPLHPTAVAYLRAWLVFRPAGGDELFRVPILHGSGEIEAVHMGDNRLLGVLRQLCKLSGVPHVPTHACRRYAATKLLECPGSSLAYVRDMLGHSDIITTAGYVGTEADKLNLLVQQMQVATAPAAPLQIVETAEPATRAARTITREATTQRTKRPAWRRAG